MKEGKISGIQLGFLLMSFLYGSTAIVNPVASAGRDIWLATLLGSAMGIGLLMMYVQISLLNSGMSLVEICKRHLGRVGGSIVSILYLWYFIHLAALVLRNFGEFMVTTGYPETPMAVLILLMVLLVMYAAKSGLQATGRTSEMITVFIPIIVIFMTFSLITIHDFSVFQPVLEKGWQPVIQTAFSLSTFPFGETVAFLMIFPYLHEKKKLRKSVLIAAISTTLILLLAASRDSILLGSALLSSIYYAPDITTKLIPGISVQPFVDLNLLIGGGGKIAICFIAASKTIQQLLGTNCYKPLVSAVAAFTTVLAIWLYPGTPEMVRWAQEIWPLYSIPFQYIMPAILLIISLIRKPKEQQNDKQI